MEQDEIKKGFEQLTALIEKNTALIEKNTAQIEKNTAQIEKNAAEVNSSLQKHDERFDQLTAQIEKNAAEVNSSLRKHDERFEFLAAGQRDLADRIDAKIDALSDRVDAEIHDLAVAVNGFSSRVEEQFAEIKDELKKTATKEDLAGFKMQMATKPYLDDKLADVRADSGRLLRKEDAKVNTVVEKLEDKKIITTEEKQTLIKLGPFVQPSVAVTP
jgi:uncharacterized phage infection (PIP) family protein YhgE